MFDIRCFLLLGAVCVLSAPLLLSAADPPYTTWHHYGGSSDSMQYSALTQVSKSNVARLQLAWTFTAPGGRLAFNPLVVDGVMFVLGRNNSTLFALDAATGKEIWSRLLEGGNVSNRGIEYWESQDRKDRRLIFGVGGSLREVNALTGEPILTFGKNGRVDLRVGEPRPLGGAGNTPGRVFGNLYITGSVTGEGYEAPPGDIRAYNILTGELVWRFRTIPLPGEFGHDTWPAEAWRYAGGANCWGEISIDEKRGIAYVPTGSATYDFYGADRHGANLFANCLLALDARTGKRLWHFQVVHHDLWDYDLTTAPKLLTLQHEGRAVDAVAVVAKFGFVYVFDRVTGQPLWPIEERPVPQSNVPGEASWPTQPFPVKPPPYARQKFTVDDINPWTDAADRARLRETLLNARNEGLFTPPAMKNTIDMPGEFGGSNWGGAAADPAAGALYVRSHDGPTMHILTAKPRAQNVDGATLEQRGRAAYAQVCLVCHGEPERNGIHSMDRSVIIAVKELGPERVASTVRQGQGQMPPFPEAVLSETNLQAILAYLDNPAAGAGLKESANENQPRVAPGEQLRFFSPYGTLNTSNGLPAIKPPWATLTAYDLNTGTIRWQVPFGTVKALEAQGLTNSGCYYPVRNGPVVTAGGVIFLGAWSDRTVRAFDKDTGAVLWELKLDANPEGMPAVYEVNGRQFIAFCTRSGNVIDNIGAPSIAWEKGRADAQGYYVFALPE